MKPFDLKKLSERRVELMARLEGMVSTCQMETRAFNEEERASYSKILDEVRSIDATLDAAEQVQCLLGEIASLGQDRVQRRGAVALGQDETVPVGVCGVVRVHVHHIEVQNGKDVHGRERAAQMPGRAVIDHVQPQKPSLGRNGFQCAQICVHIVPPPTNRVNLQSGTV